MKTRSLYFQLILDLCQLEASADSKVVQPHLDRMQTFIQGWLEEVMIKLST